MDFIPTGDHLVDIASARMSSTDIVLIVIILIILAASGVLLRYMIALISRTQSHNLTRIDQQTLQMADTNKALRATADALIELRLINGQMKEDMAEMKTRLAVLADRSERLR